MGILMREGTEGVSGRCRVARRAPQAAGCATANRWSRQGDAAAQQRCAGRGARQLSPPICVHDKALTQRRAGSSGAPWRFVMTLGRIAGLMLLAVGVALLVVGHDATDSPVEQLSKTFTGRYSQDTLWYLIGGAAAIVGG